MDEKRDDTGGFALKVKNWREYGQSTAQDARREDLKIKIGNNSVKSTLLSNEHAEKIRDIDAPKEPEEGERSLRRNPQSVRHSNYPSGMFRP